MNKLGFYVENTTTPGLREALSTVKPPVMLLHAGDRGLLREMRAGLSPDTFVIGRMYVDVPQQSNWLTSADAEAAGRGYAERILAYDFGYAKERGANGRLLVDAWMSMNEPVRGPASWWSQQPDDETKRRYAALDRFQIAFRRRLEQDGLESVAFNFAAGNFTKAEHYLDYLPLTLASYTYLGFHEYGWPSMEPRTGTDTGALFYRACMTGIRQKYGKRHKAIMTEAGLARLYKYSNDPAGDVGWLYPGETIPESRYWDSINWYNAEMVKDDYVLGCCLYQVGHGGLWHTFRHLGVDNQGRPIGLMARIATLRTGGPTPPAPEPEPPATTPGPVTPPAPIPAPVTPGLAERVKEVQTVLRPAIVLADAFLSGLSPLDLALDAVAAAVDKAPTVAGVEALQQRLTALSAAANGLPAADQTAFRAEIAALQTRLVVQGVGVREAASITTALAATRTEQQSIVSKSAEVTQTRTKVQALLKEADALLVLVASKAATVSSVAGPETAERGSPGENPTSTEAGDSLEFDLPLVDLRRQLPVAAGAALAARDPAVIRRIVVHHTATREDATPERIAEGQIARGRPGISYHYLVSTDGSIYLAQPASVITEQTALARVNAEAIGVALIGTFQTAVPSPAQLDATAALIARLLRLYGLDEQAIAGRSELDSSAASPGAQWSQGACFRESLLEAVRARVLY